MDVVKIALVTATHNRAPLLKRLYQSLTRQTDQDFTWVVIDDCSTDDTSELLEQWRQEGIIRLHVIVHQQNRGKCASLNAAFEDGDADLYQVIDSDEVLYPDAVQLIRTTLLRHVQDPRVGALHFRYRQSDDTMIGPVLGDEWVLTRPEHDGRWGKYDGSIGYLSRAVRDFRYPEFPGETYMGPTVLQLMMTPRYSIAFTDTAIGVAEYQPGGLTRSGRGLRVRNPLGMMAYTRLGYQHSRRPKDRISRAAMHNAYRIVHRVRVGIWEGAALGGLSGRLLGGLLGAVWYVRYVVRGHRKRVTP